MEDTKFIDCECTGPNIDSFSVSIGDIRFVPPPPPDVVEAARRTMKRFGELDGEAWKDVQAVCKWVLSHEAIDK